MIVKLIKLGAFNKVNVDTGNGDPKGVWYLCDKNAVAFAKKAGFAVGSEIELVIEKKEIEGETKDVVTMIKKAGGSQTQSSNSDAPKSSNKSSYVERSPEVQELIVRQSTMASAVQAMQVFTGTITEYEILEARIFKMYDAMLAKIKS
jgi:hypothetical protein